MMMAQDILPCGFFTGLKIQRLPATINLIIIEGAGVNAANAETIAIPTAARLGGGNCRNGGDQNSHCWQEFFHFTFLSASYGYFRYSRWVSPDWQSNPRRDVNIRISSLVNWASRYMKLDF
jgi:hypothetical protein